MLPRQGGVRLVRWRTSRGSLTVVLGASRLWQYQNNLDVCGWCDEEQMTTSCDVELMLKMLPVEDVLVRELFLSLVRLPNFSLSDTYLSFLPSMVWPLQITFLFPSLGAASLDHLSPSFTWYGCSGKISQGCGLSRSPFSFIHLVRLL